MSAETSFLKTVSLFEDLSEEELSIVASRFREREYLKHGLVFHEEDTGNYMYIVQAGRVKVSRLLPKDSDRYKAVNLIGVTVCNSIPHGTHRGPARLRPSVPGSP